MSNDSQPYTFLPFIQRGLATYIERDDHLGDGDAEGPEQRAQISASVKVGAKNNNDDDQVIEKTFGLKGPGDITGINPKIISRTEPAGNEDRFFPNYLPFVDFMDEDFPWRYSPAIPEGSDPNRKLRPWLFLVVLTPDEFSYVSYPDSPNDVIRIESSLSHGEVFPPPDQIWAWAHVQITGKTLDLPNSDGTLTLESSDSLSNQERKALLDFLDRNPEKVISRILCPRKLQPNQPYYGFLIPSFEMGRQAGLGKSLADTDLDVQQAAWSNGTNTNDDRQDYPVYYSWQFTTSSQGDFEALADDISPFQPAPDTDLGRIPLDISEPDHPDLDHKADQGEIEMGGALRVATQNFESIPDPSESGNTFYYNLRRLVNLADEFDRTSYDPVHDPIIYIPFYGRWHAGQGRVTDTSDWLGELNIDPRHRVAAGIGAKIVRENQEQYMAEAWQQVGQIREANEAINYARFNYAGVTYDFEKHVKQSGGREKLTMSLSNTVKVTNANTGNIVWQDIKGSRMPDKMFDYGFAKALRPGSTPARTFEVSNPPEIADRVANGEISVEPADQLGAGRQLAINNGIVTDSDLSEATIRNTSEKSDFVLTEAGTDISQWATGTDSAIGADARVALEESFHTLETFEYQPDPQYTDVTATELGEQMEVFLDPGQNFSDLAGAMIKIGGNPISTQIQSEPPIMEAPVLDKPMYKALKNLSLDYLIPNFHLIPENSTTLLELNRPFIEAYFAGLNHEFAQELLWNEYPTDQRGSYFRRFWENNVPFTKPGESASTEQEQEAEQARDITPMHEWDLSTKLGPHNPKNESGDGPMLVLVVKADLVEKFPSLNIYAHKARWVEANTDDDENFDELVWYTTGEEYRKERMADDPANKAYPQFFGKVNPDTYLVGFDLTAEEAMATEQPEAFESGLETDLDAGWFFVLEERPGDVRFGADVPESDTGLDQTPPDSNIDIDSWDKLNWGHIADAMNIDNLNGINFIDLNVINGNISVNPQLEDVFWKSQNENNSANFAYIFYQPHNRVAIHADQMIK